MVFSTKGRAPLLTDDVRPRVHSYLSEILRNLDCEDPHVGGVADHVHIVCALPRTLAPAEILMTTKKDSSKFIKTLGDYLKDFHWQGGYGLFSVGREQLAARGPTYNDKRNTIIESRSRTNIDGFFERQASGSMNDICGIDRWVAHSGQRYCWAPKPRALPWATDWGKALGLADSNLPGPNRKLWPHNRLLCPKDRHGPSWSSRW